MPPLLDIASHFFLQLAVIVITYRLLWPLLRRLGQVQVVAIMITGFLAGPSVLGALCPEVQKWLFPVSLTVGGQTIMHPNLTVIYVVGQLGLILYMFLVGASFRLDILDSHMRQAGTTAVAGVGASMLLGGLAGWWLVSMGGYFTQKVTSWQGVLFSASAIAITAFPMLAWIIQASGLLNTRVGTVSLSCAAVDDACAWALLSTVVATTKGDMSAAVLTVLGGLLYLLFMVYVGRRLLRKFMSSDWPDDGGETAAGVPIKPLCIALSWILLASWFTDVIGIYAIFGAFVVGAVMPRGQLLDSICRCLEPLVGYLLLPAFFIFSGLNTKLSLILHPATLLVAGVVLLVSFGGKFVAIGLAARWKGMSWREAGAMGSLANARGLMELILLNIGMGAGLITTRLYTILALMAIITTLIASPLQHVFERSARRNGFVFGRDGEEPDIPQRVSVPIEAPQQQE
ncbi:cation:proton antiporter domain-containing protein [Mycobacterium sp. ML4]